MYKAAVLGDKTSIAGFAALGLATFPAADGEEGARLLHTLAGSSYAVIYVTEALAAQMPEAIAQCSAGPLPAVILIPGVTGNTGEGMRRLHEAVEKAVGSDILQNQK